MYIEVRKSLLFLGVSICVTKCDRGNGEVKIGKKNSVTYFMDGPKDLLSNGLEKITNAENWILNFKTLDQPPGIN